MQVSARDSYAAFIASKAISAVPRGLPREPALNPSMAPHQRDTAAFALRLGSSGAYLDTGLGKTWIELEFAHHAAAATNGRSLILSPLAVASQIEKEARLRGYDAVRQIRDASEVGDGINICNYDRLDLLNPDAFGAVALDEASILKSFMGKTTKALIERFRNHTFRLAATATPAPNDHTEIGQHAEFLDIMSRQEMLARFFINDTSTASQEWRLKRHAETDFWDWMASWSRMAETPADFGYDASAYILPPLHIHRHRAAGDTRAPAGLLFAGDISATTMHDVKRQTATARAEAVLAVVCGLPHDEPVVVWCDTDYEADALAAVMPGAVEVRGSHTIARKEAALEAFASGHARKIITKPSICGFGLNWQHAATMIFAGRSFSYEAWYQAVRRCWRFGQRRAVDCHIIVAEGEAQIGRVIERKSNDHLRMKRAMSAAMLRSAGGTTRRRVTYTPTHMMEVPAWLRSVA